MQRMSRGIFTSIDGGHSIVDVGMLCSDVKGRVGIKYIYKAVTSWSWGDF